MTTLIEIQAAAEKLPQLQKQLLCQFLQRQLLESPGQSVQRRSVLEIEPVQLGAILQSPVETGDVLGEMLGDGE